MINPRNEPITYEHSRLFVSAIGKFHAISFAIKDQQPEKFKQLTELVYEHYWVDFEKGMGKTYDYVCGLLKECLKEEKRYDLLEKYDKALGDNVRATVKKLVPGASAEPYAVICHGDMTSNNTMFSKNSQEKPVRIQLIDWQLSWYASPVIDLVIFMFFSTTKQFRDQHYDELLKIYHASLTDLLTRLNENIRFIL